jgi:hypothetical protein
MRTWFLLLLILVQCSIAYALNQPTHELVNEVALNFSAVSDVLRDLHGFERGTEERFTGRSVREWVRAGGNREDSPLCRAANHFHDPLKPWNGAGLTDPNGLAFLCSSDAPISSLIWAQRTIQEGVPNGQCDPDLQPPLLGGTWSWPEARNCLVRALTSADPTARDKAWATVFRTMGHLMHLITDASVPEHVRNDAHLGGTVNEFLGIRDGNYEYWLSRQHARGEVSEAQFIARYLSQPIRPEPAVLRIVPADLNAPLPIASLVDTDRYNGDPNVTLAGPIGIAEFANANFFSEDTISDRYPAPRSHSLPVTQFVVPSGPHIREYYSKLPGDGLPVDTVAAKCVFDDIVTFQGQPLTMYCADAAVWARVAEAMLPRAVGYSAALLDYFFRGGVDIRSEGSGLRLVNKTPDDEAMSGWVSLYYDKATGERAPLPGWNRQMVELGANGESQTLPALVRPPDMAPGSRFMLVFEGRLGAEEGAVFGQLLSSSVLIAMTDAGSCAREPLQSLPECPSYSKEGPLTLSAQNGVVELPAAAHATSDLVVTLGPGIHPYDNPTGLYLNHVSHDHRIVFLEWKEPLAPGTLVEVTVDATLTPNAPACILAWGRRAPESPTLDAATYEDWPWFGPAGGLQGSVSFRVGGRYTLQVHPDGFMLALQPPGWWYPYPLNPIPAAGVYSGSTHCRLLLMRFLTP